MKFKFKENARAEIGTEDPFYALTYGGYLKPTLVLADSKQADEVLAAASLLVEFFEACYAEGVLEEM